MGKVVKPNPKAIKNIPNVLLSDIDVEISEEAIAAIDNQIKTQRRSYLSANHPIGYWAKAPPKTYADKK